MCCSEISLGDNSEELYLYQYSLLLVTIIIIQNKNHTITTEMLQEMWKIVFLVKNTQNSLKH